MIDEPTILTCPNCAKHVVMEEPEKELNPDLDVQCPYCCELLSDTSAPPSGKRYPDNMVYCPRCKTDYPFPENWGGTERTCFFCRKETIKYPEYNDDRIGIEEHQFLLYRSDQRGTLADEEHGVELTKWHVVAFLVMFPSLWYWFRTLEDNISAPFLAAIAVSMALCMFYLMIHGLVIKWILDKCLERSIGEIKAVIEQDELRMGGTLSGRVHLDLKKPLKVGSVGVSLELLAVKKNPLGRLSEHDPNEYLLSSCRSGSIIVSRSMMNAGGRDIPFSIEAPVHQAHAYVIDKFEHRSSDQCKFRRKTAAMDAKTLLETTKLRWLMHVELLGEDGVLLRSESKVKVEV